MGRAAISAWIGRASPEPSRRFDIGPTSWVPGAAEEHIVHLGLGARWRLSSTGGPEMADRPNAERRQVASLVRDVSEGRITTNELMRQLDGIESREDPELTELVTLLRSASTGSWLFGVGAAPRADPGARIGELVAKFSEEGGHRPRERRTTVQTTPMPRKQSGYSRLAAAAAAAPEGEPMLESVADSLFRSAMESCRQHRRLASLVEAEAFATEQRAAAAMAAFSDQALDAMTVEYERAASELPHRDEDAWWHHANMLWLASREWIRHQVAGDDGARELRDHTPDRFGDLALEYELEASALLAMRQAAEAYRRARPEADLASRPHARTD